MIFRVKYLDWKHKVQTISILSSDEKNAEKDVSSMKDVKVILNIEEEMTMSEQFVVDVDTNRITLESDENEGNFVELEVKE